MTNLHYLFYKIVLLKCSYPDTGVGQLADNVKVKILEKFSRTHALTSLSKESLGDKVCLIYNGQKQQNYFLLHD